MNFFKKIELLRLVTLLPLLIVLAAFLADYRPVRSDTVEIAELGVGQFSE
jgi:hypothetical protein